MFPDKMLEKRNIHRELGKEMERGMREEEEKTTKTACFLSPLFLSLPFYNLSHSLTRQPSL
uniref:Uncharacterized protein n=1 Tax=Anguilla anguilla TaxID=7936 RepID=A0A0E9XAM8_ANGAN